jgi:4'-phosphopantetheinyl transferase
VGTPRAVLAGVGSSEWVGWLAAHEQKAALSFAHAELRDSYVAAHILARRAAARLIGSDPQRLRLVQCCATCGGPHGKPSIEGHPRLHVSLSHTRQAVAAVAGNVPSAIDIEMPGNLVYSELRSASVFSSRELAMLDALRPAERDDAALAFWVRKECLVKLGHASLDTLTTCDVAEPAPAGLKFTEWSHPASGCIGAVAARIVAQVEFLD